MNNIPLQRCQNLCMVLETAKGRGVFAEADIPAGTVLETCPVLIFGINENREHIAKTSLYHYTYNWPLKDSETGQVKTTQAIIFGLGSLFNHSRSQNVGWTRDLAREVVIYRSLRDVKAGEELCISYGDRLTFADADAPTEEDQQQDDLDALSRIEVDGDHSRTSP